MHQFKISQPAAQYLRRKFHEAARQKKALLKRAWIDMNTKEVEYDFYMLEGLAEYMAQLRDSGEVNSIATLTDFQVDYIRRNLHKIYRVLIGETHVTSPSI